jgi:hypothetical protein
LRYTVLHRKSPEGFTPTETRKYCLHGLDFAEAIDSTSRWRDDLIEFLGGNTTLLAPIDLSENMLGRWLQGVGSEQFGHLSAFQKVDEAHTEFYQLVSTIIAYVNDGDYVGARMLLDNEFGQITRRLIVALNNLYLVTVE